ncbi:transporter substrate-binding domain-containing protein [Polaromonas sp. P1(28)-13]|nr:transporter substrate-binding domain-containing protein [Polaromonas sp. P1(28)-13]
MASQTEIAQRVVEAILAPTEFIMPPTTPCSAPLADISGRGRSRCGGNAKHLRPATGGQGRRCAGSNPRAPAAAGGCAEGVPPFGFIKNGSPEGYDIAIARMLAADMKVRLELVPVLSPDRLPYLRDGKVDLVIASLGKTPGREKLIDFSVAYAPLYNGVFGPPYGGVPESAYFKGRRIGVTKGSLEEEQLVRRLPDAAVVRYENSATIIDAYQKHEIEYIAAGNVVIESIKDMPARDRTKFVLMLNESPCHIGVRKNEDRLLARVNKFLQEASESQALMVSAMIWFKATLPTDFFQRRSP